MKWRAKLLSGLMAAGLFLTFIPRADADPPPRAGVWRHKHETREHDKSWRDHDYWKHRRDDRYAREDRDDWHHRSWEHERHDRGWWDRDHTWDHDRRYGWNGWHGGYANSPVCNGIMGRIHNDRSKIAEINPTGRHRKALQWYRDDLGNAQRDLANCRG